MRLCSSNAAEPGPTELVNTALIVGRSGYDLFGQRRFRNLWSANLLFQLCLAMLMLGVSWTMTSLTDNPVLVGMVQTVMSLPFIFLSIPIGLATDSFGHRAMLVAAQVWMLMVVSLMGFVVLSGRLRFTPFLLLATVFLVGIGVVVQQAAWKPLIRDEVGDDQLIAAISFDSLGNDLGRAVGPVIGGYLMGWFGTAVVLITSSLSQVVMLLTLRTLPKTADGGSGAAGVSRSIPEAAALVRRSPGLYGTMIRCALLTVPVGGLLGLLPLEAKENIQTGPIGYGGLLAALSIGTAAGGALLPVVGRRLRLNWLATVGVVVFGLSVLGVSQWNSMALDALFLLLLGVAWSTLTIAYRFAIQTATPPGVAGLINAFYSLVLQGSVATGSFGFAFLAQYVGVSRSILCAGVVALSGLVLSRRYPIPELVATSSP